MSEHERERERERERTPCLSGFNDVCVGSSRTHRIPDLTFGRSGSGPGRHGRPSRRRRQLLLPLTAICTPNAQIISWNI